ncbi:MAG: hypothetical protein C0467_16915, partial [Planctomycetaceae bacterium]|nr:hypothetical protein [Planctomycetaceae bacterium]
VNLNRLHKFATAMDPMSAPMFAKFLGTDNKPVSALRVTVEGGAKLTVKATVNVRLLPRMFLVGESSTTTFEKVGDKIKP